MSTGIIAGSSEIDNNQIHLLCKLLRDRTVERINKSTELFNELNKTKKRTSEEKEKLFRFQHGVSMGVRTLE